LVLAERDAGILVEANDNILTDQATVAEAFLTNVLTTVALAPLTRRA
jgi:hypothetical protein